MNAKSNICIVYLDDRMKTKYSVWISGVSSQADLHIGIHTQVEASCHVSEPYLLFPSDQFTCQTNRVLANEKYDFFS